MCSVAGACDPAVWIFSTSGFHHFFATKPVSSETSKAERWSNLAVGSEEARSRAEPPSAAQTVRADFRHTAFTKTPPGEGEEEEKESAKRG